MMSLRAISEDSEQLKQLLEMVSEVKYIVDLSATCLNDEQAPSE